VIQNQHGALGPKLYREFIILSDNCGIVIHQPRAEMPPPLVTETIHFDPIAGPLSVSMLAAYGSPGHYSLMLLEHDGFTIVKDWGNLRFSSPASNTHALPGGAAANDGRLLNALTSVGIVDPSDAYAVIMTVLQDGKKLGSLSDAGTSASDTQESELLGTLSREAAVMGMNASAVRLIAAANAGKGNARTISTRRKNVRKLTRSLLRSLNKEK
jgi:hypothetical protein